MALYASLGLEIRRQRLAAGLSQEELAAHIGVDRTTIGQWERGTAKPIPSNIRALKRARILNSETLYELLAVGSTNSERRKYTFSILAPRVLLNAGCKFGILYIRNGPAYKTGTKQIINRPINFILSGDRGELRAIVNTNSNNGFEFKCFVDFFGMAFGEVKGELESAGYLEPTIGEGKVGRVWFLLREYRILTEPATGIRNNFYFPE